MLLVVVVVVGLCFMLLTQLEMIFSEIVNISE